MNKGKLGELPIDVKKNTVETRFIKKYYINKFNFMNLGIYKNEIVIIKNIASEDKLNEYIMTYNIDGFPSIIEYSIENSTINKDKNYYKVITPFYTLYKIPMNLHNLYFSEYEYKDILLKNAPFYLTENIKKLYEFHNKLPNLYSFFDNIILNIDNTNKINNNSLIINYYKISEESNIFVYLYFLFLISYGYFSKLTNIDIEFPIFDSYNIQYYDEKEKLINITPNKEYYNFEKFINIEEIYSIYNKLSDFIDDKSNNFKFTEDMNEEESIKLIMETYDSESILNIIKNYKVDDIKIFENKDINILSIIKSYLSIESLKENNLYNNSDSVELRDLFNYSYCSSPNSIQQYYLQYKLFKWIEKNKPKTINKEGGDNKNLSNNYILPVDYIDTEIIFDNTDNYNSSNEPYINIKYNMESNIIEKKKKYIKKLYNKNRN